MRRLVIVTTAVLTALAPAAQASYTPGAVTVATDVAASSRLQLLGVSGAAYAVARDEHTVLAGNPLTDHGVAYNGATAVVSDLNQNILRWAEPKGTAWVIHRESVLGGGKHDYDSADRPLAFTTDSWLGYAGGALKRHVFGGATTTLLTGLTRMPVVRADDHGAALVYGVSVNGQARTRAGLITFGRAGVEMLQEHVDTKPTGEIPANIALTPNSVVWYSDVFHRRARTGGTVSSAPAPHGGGGLVATDTEIAVTSAGQPWVFQGKTWRQIAHPTGDVGGLAASGTTIMFALSGDDTTAGAYTLTGRVARPATRPGTVTGVDLRAGTLTYATNAGLRRATVSTGSRLTVSPPVPAAGQLTKRSGAYTLQNHKVYAGQTLVLDLTARKCRGEDISGSLVACNQPDGKNVMIDASGRFPTGTTTGAGTGEIAIWGTTIAWADQHTIYLQDLAVAGSRKTITLTTGVHDLRLSEGTISFEDDDGYAELVDRATLGRPVLLAMKPPFAADDHLVAGVAGDNLQVRTLPFGLTAKYRPRLVDTVAPATFTATWNPVFDVTKPLTNVKMVIKQGSSTIAVITGIGPAGTVSDLTWNGKTSTGANAPAGAYTWTFTADAADGDGQVTNVDGSGAVGGTVYLTR